MPGHAHRCGILFGALLLTSAFGGTQALASSESVLYAFERDVDGAGDGNAPFAGLIADKDGNLFGTTVVGGSAGEGTVFKLAPDGTETILHSFPGGDDGYSPEGGLIADVAGNLYGTTELGGIAHNKGTVFTITSDGAETVLYRFTGGSDGGNPMGTLIADGAGNLYGTTYTGGAKKKGVVFMLAPDGSETVLHSFGSGKDGARPEAGLVADGQGNFFGTTFTGGSADAGAVFKLAADGTETVLHSFGGEGDGIGPAGELLADGQGDFYGTTQFGGAADRHCQIGCGMIFKIGPDGREYVLYRFAGGQDGREPSSRLILDAQHNLYGTTLFGGAGNKGTAFKLAPDGTETVLYSFTGKTDGKHPSGPLLADAKFQHLYGETSEGGHTQGVVYVITP
jgi:uncharacterized repeat protein (TIGR03803 family)